MNDQPAVWIDGDPLMEAIAAAAWDGCERGGNSTVFDDPRNIAAAVAGVARGVVLREVADQQEATAATDVIRRRRSLATARRVLAAELRLTAADEEPTSEQPRVVAYRSPGTRALYCVTCARQETGWQPVTDAEVRDDTVCDFCGGRVLAVASQTLGEVVARYVAAPAPAARAAYAQGIRAAIAELKRDALGVLPRLEQMAAEAQATQPRLAAYQTCPVCKAGYETGTKCSQCAFNARMAAETRPTP